jgi:hypothetical protein
VTDFSAGSSGGAFPLLPESTANTGISDFITDSGELPRRVPEAVAPSSDSELWSMALDPSDDRSNAVPEPIANNWTKIVSSGISPSLFRRLLALGARPDQWRGPGSSALTNDAVAAFVTFWEAVRNEAVEPSLALTSSGGIEAQWYRSPREHLHIRYRSPERVFVSLFFRPERIWEGVDTAESVARHTREHDSRPLTWKG